MTVMFAGCNPEIKNPEIKDRTVFTYTATVKLVPDADKMTRDDFNAGASTYNTSTKQGELVFDKILTKVDGSIVADNLKDKLLSIVIPSTVETVCTNAFKDYSKLNTVTMLPTEPPEIYEEAFPASVVVVYVPEASKDAYTAATDWKNLNYDSLLCLQSDDRMWEGTGNGVTFTLHANNAGTYFNNGVSGTTDIVGNIAVEQNVLKIRDSVTGKSGTFGLRDETSLTSIDSLRKAEEFRIVFASVSMTPFMTTMSPIPPKPAETLVWQANDGARTFT